MSINREIAAALDLRTVLQKLLTAALQHVGGERGSIVVMDDTGKPIDATIVYGKKFHEHTTQQLRDTVERGLAGWVVKNRKPALVPDTSKDNRWLRRADDAAEKSGAKSALCVPLMARDRLIGVLTLVHPIPNTFDEQHLELMQAIADQASVAVLNARLYTESQRTARIMTALAEGAAAMNTSLELQDVWRHLINQTLQALQVETVAIALMDGSNELVFQAAAGRNFGHIPGKRIKNGEGLTGMVMNRGQAIIAPNVSQDQSYGEADRFEGVEMRSVAIAPIQSQGKIMGVLEAINPISGGFDADALVVMTGLGNLAGSTIQNAQFMDRLQKAHTRYLELFEDSVDPIIITDWEGRVLEVNRQAVTLSGFTIEQLHEMSIDQLHKVNWNKTGLNFETLQAEQDCIYESVLYVQSGTTIPVEVHARRVEFEETDSAQWILRDITERKELDSLRDDMTAMIYHDLRSPLGNIVSSLDMMNGLLPEDETLQTMLTIANNSTMRINRLINSLLDINRLESGQPIVDQQAVDPVELIRESIRDVMPNITSRRQTLDEKAAPPYPYIWVDVDMIHRVLINLMENASKFTPVEGRVEIGAIADGIFVKFWVRDNGPGIPDGDRDRIFEKFTRLRGKDKPGGLGVGLAFCRLAVLGHGGNIWVESELGSGTTFWLSLPVAQKKATGQLKRQTGRLTIKPEHAHRFQNQPDTGPRPQTS
jgi:PAS domain S-box-containing protein